MTTVLCAADLAVYRLATNTLPVNADGTIGEAPDDATLDALRTGASTLMDAGGHPVAMKGDPRTNDRPKSWIQVARVGEYAGHPAGKFKFDAKTFDKIVTNFQATANRRVPLDFEHASEMAGSEGSIPMTGAPATGWIVALQNRGDQGLWGLVEWLEPGHSYVKEGRYLFFSPAVVFHYVDGASGALTNRPFLDGMAPVTARAVTDGTLCTEDNMKIEELMKVLSLAMGDDGKDLTVDNVGERVGSLMSRLATAESTVTTMKAEARKSEEAQAEKDVDAVIGAGLVANTPEARANALDVRLNTPKAFATMFGARLADAAKKGAKKTESKTEVTGAEVSDDAKKLLTQRVAGAQNDTPNAPIAQRLTLERRSDKVAAMADQKIKANPERYSKNGRVEYRLALNEADRELAAQERAGQ